MGVRKTHDAYLRELAEKNPNIECLGIYTSATEKILHRCKVCGFEWEVMPTSLINKRRHGCPHCAAVKAGRAHAFYTKETYNLKLSQINDSIELVGKYNGSHKKALFHCNRCGFEWSAMPYSVLQGHGCPKCVKSGTSFMEQVFLKSLRDGLPDCEVLSRDRKTIGRELDIYIPSKKLAIEPGRWFFHRIRLDKDREKLSICNKMGIRLIFVYDGFPHDETPPFENDCFTFTGNFNSDDHSHLWQMVDCLLKEAGSCITSNELNRRQIESEAYESSKSITHDEFLRRVSSLHPNIEVLGKYTNSNRRILVRCKTCGRKWNAVPANLLSGDGCFDCGRKESGIKERVPLVQYMKDLAEINPMIDIDQSTYKGTHSIVHAVCKDCGYEWDLLARNLIRKKNPLGCPYCGRRHREEAANEKYIRDLSEVHPDIICLQRYKNRSTKLWHRCETCGYEWKTAPQTILKSKYGCPNWRKHGIKNT